MGDGDRWCGGGLRWIYCGWWWELVDVCGWWWLVVDIFSLVVGSSGWWVVVDTFWLMVVGGGGWRWVVA